MLILKNCCKYTYFIVYERHNQYKIIVHGRQNIQKGFYLEDFSKPKILWKRVGSILRFCYNDNETLGLDSTCFATGENIEFICCVLNPNRSLENFAFFFVLKKAENNVLC